MGVNASIGNVHGPTDPGSLSMANDKNGVVSYLDADILQKPSSFVYVFTVAKREFQVNLPPQLRSLSIPACGPKERYKLVTRLPQPFQQACDETDRVGIRVRTHDARKIAMDICNPSNTSLDQDMKLDPKFVLGSGNDLTRQGVFWSLNETPTEKEIAAAEGRRAKYYRGLLEHARTLELANPKELEFALTQDYHMAADFFGEERTWHKWAIRFACSTGSAPWRRA